MALARRLWDVQLLRFLVVGSFNTGLCYVVYALLVLAGLPIWAANLGALCFGIGLSFFAMGRFVFGARGNGRLLTFILAWGAIYALQTEVIYGLNKAGMSAMLAGLIVLPGTAVLSFIVQKLVVFR